MPDDLKRMEEKHTGRLLWEFVAPAMIGLLTNALYNIVDRIFVGRGVGPIGLSALTLSFPAMITFFSVVLLVAQGAAALLSIRLGQKKMNEVHLICGNALTFAVVLSVLCAATGLVFSRPIMQLFGATAELLPAALTYMRIILCGFPFMLVGFTMNYLIRSEGFPLFSVKMLMVSSLTNIILDPIFIFGFHMGVAGAAWATVIAQSTFIMLGIYHLSSKRTHIKLTRRTFVPQLHLLGLIAKIGFPAFVMELAFGFQNLLMNRQLVQYGGANAVAAMGIIFGVETIATMPIFAIADGLQPIVGYNYGANRMDRVHSVMRYCYGTLLLICIVLVIPAQLFPGPLASVFIRNADAELLATTTTGLRLFLTAFPFFGFILLVGRYFLATGNAGYANILAFSKPILFFIPALYLLAHFFGLNGIWLSEPASALLTALLAAALLLIHKQRTKPSDQ